MQILIKARIVNLFANIDIKIRGKLYSLFLHFSYYMRSINRKFKMEFITHYIERTNEIESDLKFFSLND